MATEEETYYLRMVSLLIDVAPKAVRAYFDRIYPPSNLAVELQKSKKTLKSLRFQSKVLTAYQWNILFPQGSANVASINFDLTLMICLLRNLSGITPPVGGFDVLPPATDISVADDLARIKYYRNSVAHSNDSKICKQAFEDAWNDVSQGIERIGGIGFKEICSNRKISNLDSESYRDILINIKQSQDEKDNILKETVQKMLDEHSVAIQKKFDDPVPPNVRARFEKIISKWRTEDTVFFDTNTSKQILKALKKKDFVTIIGSAGIGKTVTTRHVALQMLADGYDILPLKSPSELLLYAVSDRKMLFIFDDVCGRYSAIQHEIEDWDRYTEEIKICFLQSKMKILSNCRLEVCRNQHFQVLEIFTQCEFNLTDGKFACSAPEKRTIAKMYLSDTCTEKLSDQIIDLFDCFPLLCSMASQKDESEVLSFLSNPYDFFEKELEQLIVKGDLIIICALAVVTLLNNSLNESLLVDTIDYNMQKMFDDIFEAFDQPKRSRSNIKEDLDSLLTSYISKQDDVYSFMHQKLFDIMSSFLAKKMLPCMLDHCNTTFLCERFVFDFITGIDDEFLNYIKLPSKYESKFFTRLLDNVDNENLLDIFGCKQMKNEKYRQKFLGYIKTMNGDAISNLLHLSCFGITLFHLMCKFGYEDFIQFCLTRQKDVDPYDDIGMTPLHIACKYDQGYAINVLLENGANPNKHIQLGYTALYEACKTGKIEIVRQLLNNGADPNLCNEHLIPLLVACANGYIEIVQMLIENNANVNIRNHSGFTALYQACMNGKKDIVNILINSGANVDVKTLYYACTKSDVCIIELLMSRNANFFDIWEDSGRSPLSVLLQKDKSFIVKKILKKSSDEIRLFKCLAEACDNNDSRLVEAILETNLDINRYTDAGETVLQIASGKGCMQISKLLIDKGANVNQYSFRGETPLQVACLRAHTEVVSLLLSEGADINILAPGTYLPPPLHIACVLNKEEIVSTLISFNADVNAIAEFTFDAIFELRRKKDLEKLYSDIDPNSKYTTCPLEIATIAKEVKIVETLLQSRADPSAKDKHILPSLLIACFYRNIDLIKLLLKHNSNVNICENIDGLCLTYMQCAGQENIFDLFLNRKDLYTSTSVTALHIVCMSGMTDAAEVLLKHRARTDIVCNISPFLFSIQNETYQMTGDSKYLREYYINTGDGKYLKEYYIKIGVIENALPLNVACFMGNAELVETLSQRTSSRDKENCVYINHQQVACIHGQIDKGSPKAKNRKFSLTPLQTACLGNHWDTCKVLIDGGVDINKLFDVSNLLITSFNVTTNELEDLSSKMYKTSVIHLAYRSNARDLVRKMINSGCDIDIGSQDGIETIFYHACNKGDIEMVKFLASKSPQLNIKNIQGRTPLHCACEHNYIEVVDILFSLNVDFDCTDINGETPLHTACKKEFPEIVQMLLRKGSNPIKLTLYGENAYHLACKYNNIECINCLLQFTFEEIDSVSSDTVPCTDICTHEGKSLLYFAYKNHNMNMMDILIKYQANINLRIERKESLLVYACRSRSKNVVEYLLQHSADLNARNIFGKTPLYIVCKYRYNEITKVLLDCDVDVNIKSANGHSPLYWACAQDNLEIMELLLKKEADPDTCISLKESDSLLINSCKRKSYSVADLLLRYGANVSYQNKSGNTALFYAFLAADAEILALLLRHGADGNVCRHEKLGSIHYASQRGMIEIVTLILNYDKHIDVNATYLNKETALYACFKALNKDSELYDNYIQTGDLLMQFGADILSQTMKGDTPFHQLCINGRECDIHRLLQSKLVNEEYVEKEFIYASSKNNIGLVTLFLKLYHISFQALHKSWFKASEGGNTEIINYLVDQKYDVNVINENGETALHIASVKGHIGIIRSLLRCDQTDLHKKTDRGFTPVHLACLSRKQEVCKLLLEKGASVNEKTNNKENIFNLAISNKCTSIIRLLYDKHRHDLLFHMEENLPDIIDLYLSSPKGREIVRMLLGYCNENCINTALHLACENSDNDLVDIIMSNTYRDLNCVNECGETPLLISISKLDVRNVLILLNMGASVNITCDLSPKGAKNCFGLDCKIENVSPLHMACFVGELDIVEELIKRVPKCNNQMTIFRKVLNDNESRVVAERCSPLLISVLQNDEEIVEYLLKKQSDIKSIVQNTVLLSTLYNRYSEIFLDEGIQLTSFQACILGSIDSVKSFIENCAADIDKTFTITPMLLSVAIKTPFLMKDILNKYNYEDQEFKTEVTPLVYSALIGNLELMKLLLKKSANPYTKASLCIIHLIALNKDISESLLTHEPINFLQEKCNFNSFFITFLKCNEEQTNLLLANFQIPRSSSLLTALHYICIRGLNKHFQIILEQGVTLNRQFEISCIHILLMAKYDNIEYHLSIDYEKPLTVSTVELSCFVESEDMLKSIVRRSSTDNTLVILSPFFMMTLFENSNHCVWTFRDLNFVSTISAAILINYIDKQYCINHNNTNAFSQIVTIDDFSVKMLLLLQLMADNSDDDDSMQYIFRVIHGEHTFELNLCLLAFFNMDTRNFSPVLFQLDVSRKQFKLNFIYWFLMTRNVHKIQKYNSLFTNIQYIDESLKFTALESIYMMQKKTPHIFLENNKAVEEEIVISPLVLACIRNCASVVRQLAETSEKINEPAEITTIYLSTFIYDLDECFLELIINSHSLAKVNPLLIACFKGNSKIIYNLLQHNCDTNVLASVTPLHILFIQNFDGSSVIDELTELELQALDSECCKLAPAHILCFNNDTNLLKSLLWNGCDLCSDGKLSTHCFNVLQGEYTELVLEKSPINAVSEMTPLHLACMMDNEVYAKLMLTISRNIDLLRYIFPLHLNHKHSNRISSEMTINSSFLLTPLHICILQENTNIAEILIEEGANTDMTASLSIELQICDDKYISTQSTIKPVQLACIMNNCKMLEHILSKTNIINEFVPVSIFHLCYFEMLNYDEFLLPLQNEVHIMLNALHIACFAGSSDQVTLLLNEGANPNIPLEMPPLYAKPMRAWYVKKHPLHLCSALGNFQICQTLLEHGADSNARTNIIGLQPWHLALLNDNLQVLDLLLSKPFDIERTKFMFVFLLYLIRKFHSENLLQVISKSRFSILLGSLYRYLLNVLSITYA